MKQYIFGIILIALPLTTFAQNWEQFAESPGNEFDNTATTFYYDKSTIEVLPNFKQVWTLSEPTRQANDSNNDSKSAKILIAIQCESMKWTLLNTLIYEGPMASGSILSGSTADKPKWWKIKTDSIMMTNLHKVVCE